MKQATKWLALLVLAALCAGLLCTGAAAAANGWVQEDGAWHYYRDGVMAKEEMLGLYADGTETSKEYREEPAYRYYVDGSGAMVTGWYQIKEFGVEEANWFYFDASGRGHEGWLQSGGKWYYCYQGFLVTHQSVTEDGETYYVMDGDGILISDPGWHQVTFTSGGIEYSRWVYVDSDGTGHNGWLTSGGYWYYVIGGWAVQGGSIEIDGTPYFFDSDGHILTTGGWYHWTTNNQQGERTWWAYIEADGTPAVGWQKLGGYWYYFQNGEMVADGSVYDEASGKEYFFDSNGHLAGEGWHKDVWIDPVVGEITNWFYCNADGSGYNGWKQDGGYWYYFDNGWMTKDSIRFIYNEGSAEEGYNYHFDANGHLSGGWVSEQWRTMESVYTVWYYFDANGRAHDGWLQSGGKWYYTYSNGQMAADTEIWDDDGTWYFMNADGTLSGEGWHYQEWTYIDEDDQEHVEGRWYYTDANGEGVKGWKQIGGVWYYFWESCEMAAGDIVWDGDRAFYMEDNGHLAGQGWHQMTDYEGNHFWFCTNASGEGATDWVKSGSDWYYADNGFLYTDGTYMIDGQEYTFDADGRLIG